MRLLADLRAVSPRRVAALLVVVVAGAAAAAVSAAMAGHVLVDRSRAAFTAAAVALVVAAAADLAASLLIARITAVWSASVRRRLCRAALGQDLPTIETTPVGELLDRIDGDVNQVASTLRGAALRLAQTSAAGIAAVAAAIVLWWPVGVGMVVLGLLLAAVLVRPMRAIGPARVHEEEAWSDVAAVTEEAVHGQDDIRTALARPYVLRLYAERSAELLRRGRRVWRLSGWISVSASVVTMAGVVVVALVGVSALAAGRVDAARLTAIWLLVLAFGSTVEHFSRIVTDLQEGLGAWGRVQLLAASRQEPGGGAAPSAGDLEVRGLTFSYGSPADPDGRPPALRDVRLTFTPGRSYALVGRSGSGKSTLAKVLTRAVDVPPGTVFLGGRDITELDVEQLRRVVALVPQRTEILAGTVIENVTLFDDSLAGGAEAALAELGLADWVASLPDGAATRLGDGGQALSAGQAQLVAFARILVRAPLVVVLDEATARLDPVTERRVQAATERLLRGRIGIVIAHRLSSVERCDEVVVLADGQVAEARPMRDSQRFARLLATSRSGASAGTAAVVLDERPSPVATPVPAPRVHRVDPPPLPPPPPARTLRQIVRLTLQDPRYGVSSVALFSLIVVLGLDGSVLAWLWADVVDGVGDPVRPAIGIAVALVLVAPLTWFTSAWFPQWWVRQMLRIGLRLVHGQTGPRRVSAHTPAEVVAQAGDTERAVMLADNVVDQAISVVAIVVMTAVSGSVVPALFFAGTMVASGVAAHRFGPWLERSARRTVAARAAFATALSSSLSAAATVKLAGATRAVLDHLARLDGVRNEQQRREVAGQVWARSTPSVASGLLPIAVWALYLGGGVGSGTALVAVSVLQSARWFAWTTASLVSSLPSARVWTRRTVAMGGVADYAAPVPGVDLAAGTAPAPATPPRRPLRRLELRDLAAVHEDGTVGVHGVDLVVERGQLVLVVGEVGSGKSSLLRALAGIVHHTGELRWNGEPVAAPEAFLRPAQVSYVAQLPRVVSGTVAENVALGHAVDAGSAVGIAQLEPDLAAAGAGLGLLIGHKGTRLSGGQLQRLALARALAPRTELLVADDVSSALDVTTELALWQRLREHGVTVVGSTSKRAALARADHVLVLAAGRPVAGGRWTDLEPRWGHLAG